MLKLTVKRGDKIYFGDTPITITQVRKTDIRFNFNGEARQAYQHQTHFLPENIGTLLVKWTDRGYARLALSSPLPILRGKVYDSSQIT